MRPLRCGKEKSKHSKPYEDNALALLQSWCTSFGWLHIVLCSVLVKYAHVGHNWQVLVRTGGCKGELCGRRSETALCWLQPCPDGSTRDKTDPVLTMCQHSCHQRSAWYLGENVFKKGWSLLQGECTREDTGEDIRGCKRGDSGEGTPTGWLQPMKEPFLQQWKRVRSKDWKNRKPLWTDPNLLCFPPPRG